LIFTNVIVAKSFDDRSGKITLNGEKENTYESIYSSAYVINSFASELFLNKGIAKIKDQNYELALLDFQQSIALNPGNFCAYLLIGETMTALNRQGEALLAFEKAIDLNPFYGEAYFKRASFFQKIGDFKEAFYNFSLAMYINPTCMDTITGEEIDVLSFQNFFKQNQALKVSQNAYK